MSKTDKTTPTWVVTMRNGVVTHNHRHHALGECVINQPNTPQPARWKHQRVCAKRQQVTTYCTKAEPNRVELGWVTSQTCWTMRWNDEEQRRIWTSCSGHTKTVWDDATPCVCDGFPAQVTCWACPPDTHKYPRGRDPERVKGATRWGGPGRKADQRAAIADFDEPDVEDRPGLKRMFEHLPRWTTPRCSHGYERWEARIRACCWYDWEFRSERIPPRLPVQDEEFEDERLAEWELELLGAPKGSVWTTEHDSVWAGDVDYEDEVGEPAPYERVDDEDDEDYEPESTFLTATPEEFFDAVGDAWVFEGPAAPADWMHHKPARGGHYVRVHQLAREVGIEARDLVTFLRSTGEYVRGHQSWIAEPVAERMRAKASGLQCAFGLRKDAQRAQASDEALAALRDRLLGADRPAKVARRPNYHLGNNPFAQDHPYMRSNA